MLLSVTVSPVPCSERVSRDAAGSPPRAVNLQLLDLGDVVVGEKSLLSSKASRPPSRRIWSTNMSELLSHIHHEEIYLTNSEYMQNLRFTLFDDVNNIFSIKAELVRVLSVVGVQSFALGHLWFGLWRRLRSSSARRRPAG